MTANIGHLPECFRPDPINLKFRTNYQYGRRYHWAIPCWFEWKFEFPLSHVDETMLVGA